MQANVSAPTRAGRALRRSLLKGCVVVIVVAGYSGKRFVYERAHELGIRCRPPLSYPAHLPVTMFMLAFSIALTLLCLLNKTQGGLLSVRTAIVIVTCL